MQIVIVGTGYVGLVSGACLADFGHLITCVDSNSERIATLLKGKVPFYEPGLEELVAHNVRAKRLEFTTDLAPAVSRADVVFIAVGTPARNGDGNADLTYVYQAAREVARALNGFTVIVTKSTVPVGVGDEIELIVRETRPDAEFSVASNPEFLREGAAIRDFKLPDRIVIGTNDARSREVMAQVYRPLYLNAAPILYTERRNAELIKYAANAFLATKITFINEIADLCEHVGGDIQEVARGIGMDNRIGSKFLHAGPGFGGSCFPKDTSALLKTSQDHGTHLRIVEAVIFANEQRKRAMARKVTAALDGDARGKIIGVLGLTFKPNTDDMRDAPALTIVTALEDMGAKVRAYDPVGMDRAREQMPGVVYCENPYECAQGAHALVIITEWEEFRALDLERIRLAMARPILIDLRNIYDRTDMRKRGFTYVSVGRPVINSQNHKKDALTHAEDLIEV